LLASTLYIPATSNKSLLLPAPPAPLMATYASIATQMAALDSVILRVKGEYEDVVGGLDAVGELMFIMDGVSEKLQESKLKEARELKV